MGKKKQRQFLILILTGFILSMCTAVIAQDDVMTLSSKAFGKPGRPSVVFRHGAHSQTFDCTACHHVFQNGQNVWDQTSPTACAECHKPQSKDGSLTLRPSFHKLCMDCHKKVLSQGKQSGPVMCGHCHKR